MNFLKVIAPIFVASILILPFFVLSNIFDGHIWGPFYFVVFTGSLLVMALSFCLYINKKQLFININTPELLMLFAFLYVFVNTISNKYGVGYVSNLYLLAILILSIITTKSLLFSKGNYWQVLFIVSIIILIATVEGVWGLLQIGKLYSKNQSLFKIAGTFNNSGVYANYLSIICVFALGLFLHVKNNMKWLRYLSLLAICIIFVVLPFTEARTSWLAVIAGSVAVSWRLIKSKPIIIFLFGNAKRKVLTFSVLLIGVFILFALLYQYKAQSARGRLLIYEVSLNMIKEKPIFGHGFGRFLAEYNTYQADYFKNHPHSDKAMLADNVKTGFNEFIQVTVELGLTGLVLFIGLIVLLFRSKPNPEWEFLALSSKGALSAALVCCLFSYPLRILPIAVTIVFLLAIIIATCTDIGYNLKIGRRIYKPLSLIATIIALFVCYLQWKDFDARKQWKQAIDYTQLHDFEKAFPYYQMAYKTLNYDGFFLYNYGSELLDIDTLKGIKILEEATYYLSDNDLYVYLGDGYRALKNYDKAEYNYHLSSFMVPCKFYPKYQLFKLYCETNQYLKARNIAQSITKMKVKVPSLTVFEIKSEVDEWLIKQK